MHAEEGEGCTMRVPGASATWEGSVFDQFSPPDNSHENPHSGLRLCDITTVHGSVKTADNVGSGSKSTPLI